MKLVHQIGVLRVGFDEECKGLTVECDIDATSLPDHISLGKRKAGELVCAIAHRAATEAMKACVGPNTMSTTTGDSPQWMKDAANADNAKNN